LKPGPLAPAAIVGVYLALAALKPFVFAWGTGQWFWVVDAVFFVLMPLVLWGLASAPARALRFAAVQPSSAPPDPADLWMLQTLGYLAALGAIRATLLAIEQTDAAASAAHSAAAHWPWPQVAYAAQMGSGAMRVALACYAALTAALVEEWVFRVLLLRVAQARAWSAVVYVGVSSVLFALAHVGPGPVSVLFTWLAGVGLAALFWRWRLFGPAVLAHFVFDLASFW
jgi:membrane protease YdiL (CAAX protease family)